MQSRIYRRSLSPSEIRARFIIIQKEFHDFFPAPGVEFTLREKDRKYPVSRDNYNRIFHGISVWIRDHPELTEGDTVVIRKQDDDFVISVERGKGERKIPEAEPKQYDFDHDEIINKLVDIGNWIGFEANAKEQVAIGAIVDAVWKVKIGNLGEIKYVFEVQKRGSIDSAIRNLQRAQKSTATQKIVVVGIPEIIEKVKAEVKGEPIERILTYMDVKSVEKAWQLMNDFRIVMEEVGLVKREMS